MAQPTPYARAYDFAGFQTSNPSTPLPAAQVEIELNRILVTLTETLANLALIQRDDTELANNTVGLDQLKPEVTFGLNSVTSWLTATDYALNDGVWQGGKLYYCAEAHTSGTFSTDLAAVKWVEILDFDAQLASYVTDAEAAQTAAETAQGLAETAQTAAETAQGLAEAAQTAAETAQTNAETAKTDAETAQGLAEAAQAAAEAAFDSFDDIYLGAKASDPTVDNDGDALAAGMLYYNTGANTMKVYSGATWASISANSDAVGIDYNNATSGLTATDVQAALDELDGVLDPMITKLAGIETGADVTDEANVVGSLDGATLSAVTVAAGDKVLVQDADDSDNLKTVTAQSIADMAAGGATELLGVISLSAGTTGGIALPTDGTGAFKVEVRDWVNSNAGGILFARVSTDGGSTMISSGYLGRTWQSNSLVNTALAAGTLASGTYFPVYNFAGGISPTTAQYAINLGFDLNVGDKSCSYTADVVSTANNGQGCMMLAYNNPNAQINYLQLGTTSGTATFDAYVYQYKDA